MPEHILRRLRRFTWSTGAVCAVICIGTLIAAGAWTGASWGSAFIAVAGTLLMALCGTYTTWKTANFQGEGLQIGWIALDYVLKLLILLATLLLTSERIFGAIVAIVSVVGFMLTQVICLIPTRKDPRIG